MRVFWLGDWYSYRKSSVSDSYLNLVTAGLLSFFLMFQAILTGTVQTNFGPFNHARKCALKRVHFQIQAFRVKTDDDTAVPAIEMRVRRMVGIWGQTIMKSAIICAEPVYQFPLHHQIQDPVNGNPVYILRSAHRFMDLLGTQGGRAVSNNFQDPEPVRYAVQTAALKQARIVTLLTHL